MGPHEKWGLQGDLARIETRECSWPSRGTTYSRLIFPKIGFETHLYEILFEGELNEKLRQVKEVNPYIRKDQ